MLYYDDVFFFLAHLSRRLTRWAYSIPVDPACVRACVRPSFRKHFQTWISLRPDGQLPSNFIWSITGLIRLLLEDCLIWVCIVCPNMSDRKFRLFTVAVQIAGFNARYILSKHPSYLRFYNKLQQKWKSNSDLCLLMELSCWLLENHMSRVMRKPTFCIVVTGKLISAFVFATCVVQYLYFLKPRFLTSNHLLWLCSPVCFGPGRRPWRPVFLRMRLICCDYWWYCHLKCLSGVQLPTHFTSPENFCLFYQELGLILRSFKLLRLLELR